MVGFSPLGSSPLGDDGVVVSVYAVDNIVTGSPVVSDITLVDHALDTSEDLTSGTPVLATIPLQFDNSQIDDWYDYFFEPITYLGVELTQAHSLSAQGFTASSPEIQTASLTINYPVTASSILTGLPLLNTADLAEDYNLTASAVVTGSPVVPDATMAEAETFSAPNLLVGTPEVNTTNLTQLHDLIATSIVTDQSEVTETTLSQDHQLSPSSVVTASPEVPSVTATIVSTIELTASEILTGTPEVNTTSLVETSTLNPEDILTPFPDLGEPIDPNQIIQQETKEIEQMFGGWPRRAYEVPDGRLVQAEREIEATYGDRVSIDRKAKSLIKFGRSAELGTTGLETVWTVGGDETYVSSNSISYISSSSASDTQQITIEGHTVNADGEFTFVVQTATLDGQNAVALDTDVARVSRAYNSDSTELAGRVVVYENATVVGGIPTDETKIHIDIPLGFQQSFKAATTFSKDDYYLVTGFYGAVSAKQAAAVDFYVEIRDKGKVFLPKGCFTASSTGGAADINLDPAILVPKNADIRVRCETETNNAVVFGIFKGYLAKVLN